MRILLVEDNVALADSLTLKRAGYAVDWRTGAGTL